MTTDYPEHGKVVIKLEETSKEPLTINLRRPVWAAGDVAIRINGSKQKWKVFPVHLSVFIVNGKE